MCSGISTNPRILGAQFMGQTSSQDCCQVVHVVERISFYTNLLCLVVLSSLKTENISPMKPSSII